MGRCPSTCARASLCRTAYMQCTAAPIYTARMPMLSDQSVGKRIASGAGNTFHSTADHAFVLAVSLPLICSSAHYWHSFPEQYALTEASYTMVKLLQRYNRIENADPDMVEPIINSSLTLSHDRGVHIRLFSSWFASTAEILTVSLLVQAAGWLRFLCIMMSYTFNALGRFLQWLHILACIVRFRRFHIS